MSLNQQELTEHCLNILGDSRIKNRVVVLCEGKVTDEQGRRSPQLYKRMEEMPDANFYSSCVPKSWQVYRPRFFTCGDKVSVINTYFRLKELHTKDPKNSYLNPDLLFAIVDLDIGEQTINNYKFSDTENIFHDLYSQFNVNPETAPNHRIWVTGFTHKEAYFLIPELQELLAEYEHRPHYRDKFLNLDNLYLDMMETLDKIKDFKVQENNPFPRVSQRIKHCPHLDCSELSKLQQSWVNSFKSCANNSEKTQLIRALLTIAKAKFFWEKVKPPTDSTITLPQFREQLSLELGKKFYSEKEGSEYHISFFLKSLYQHYQKNLG